MFKKLLLMIGFLLSVSFPVGAQSSSPSIPPPPPPRNNGTVEQDLNLPPDMRSRLAIERAEHLHREALKDVEKLNELSAEVTKKFQEQGNLSSAELKKVGDIEKLAKSVLNHAGGSKVDDESDKDQKMTVGVAIEQMGVAVAGISKTMIEETRYVVSAKVIDLSNKVINLAKFIRRAKK